MTYAELVRAVRGLTVEERWALLDVLIRSLREDLAAPRQTDLSSERVLGLFRGTDPPPTDDEVKEMYIDYLVEKYR